MSQIRSCLYRGKVAHQRLLPFKHSLAYTVYALLLDLEEAPKLDKETPWFGFNRRALLSFYERDHGDRSGKNLLEWVRGELAKANLTDVGHRVSMLCFPRVLGCAFNHVSIYFCYAKKGRLGAVLYEMKNPFGELHCYLFPVTHTVTEELVHSCTKEFYLSPFIGMNTSYHFTLTPPTTGFHLQIRQNRASGEMLRTTWGGTRLTWTDKNLKKCFWRHPLLTFKVMAGFCFHALLLIIKGARFRHKPPAPRHAVSVIRKP